MAYLERVGFSHGDIRPTLILFNSQSDYNFNQSTQFILSDSLAQFYTWEEKQIRYIEQDYDLYLPPDLYESLARRHPMKYGRDPFK